MSLRVAAIEVSHWHSVHDPAYLPKLRRLQGMSIAALHDPVRHGYRATKLIDDAYAPAGEALT